MNKPFLFSLSENKFLIINNKDSVNSNWNSDKDILISIINTLNLFVEKSKNLDAYDTSDSFDQSENLKAIII